jgi:hypothetical protein
LKNTKIEEPLPHYAPLVSKKIKAKDLDRENILQVLRKNDITLDENYNFNKAILPQNFKLLNHLLFDFLIISSKKGKKIILLKDKDELINRDSMLRVQNLAKNNSGLDFFHMANTDENTKLLKEKYNLEFKNYPQLIILDTGKNSYELIPQVNFLSILENKLVYIPI